ncbi:MAG: hypothetical protein U5K79_16720 [Cyclobacteriaceae bacterium]|nr:hypothetical protein [Cyclobacteriaceae bacterium]
MQDVLKSNGFRTALLDVSFSAHMPDCLEMPYKPMIYGESEKGHAYRLGGHTCLAGDFMGTFYFPKPLAVGDRLLFDDMIHYTMVKTTTFNGVGLAFNWYHQSRWKFSTGETVWLPGLQRAGCRKFGDSTIME